MRAKDPVLGLTGRRRYTVGLAAEIFIEVGISLGRAPHRECPPVELGAETRRFGQG